MKKKVRCLHLLSVAVIKHHDPKQLRKEGVCFPFRFTVYYKGKSGQELKAGTQRQKLQPRPWRNADYWLAPHALLCLLFYTTEWVGLSTVGWVLPH